jgi:hypothetical protein
LPKVVHSLKSKKSVGLDGISPYSLKKCVHYVLTPLLELVNASIREGIFPSKLKYQYLKEFTQIGPKKMQTIIV